MRAILSVVDNNPEAVVKVGLLCNFSCNSHQVSQECLAKQTSPLTHEHEACQQPTNKNRLREHEGQGQDEDEEVDDDEYQEETKRERKNNNRRNRRSGCVILLWFVLDLLFKEIRQDKIRLPRITLSVPRTHTSSSSSAADSISIGFRGMTNMCTGACGETSLKAMHFSSS